MNLHGQIMNIQVDHAKELDALKSHNPLAYKMGHRDARHAAAELALKVEDLEDALRLFVAAGVGSSTDHTKQAQAHKAAVAALQRMAGIEAPVAPAQEQKDPSSISLTSSEANWLVNLATAMGGRLERWAAKPSQVPPVRAMNGLVSKGLAQDIDGKAWKITPQGRQRCTSIY